MKKTFFKLGVLSALLLLAVWRAFALEGFVVIANENAPASSLSAAQLKDIYTGKTTYWEGGQAIVIVYIGDKTDAALKEISGMDSSAFKTFWQRLAFSGRGQQPKKVEDSAAAIAAVSSTKGAIAIVAADTDLKGVKKIEAK
jgi:ABC-type phosphate transport system substrate-binding protein